MTTHIKTPRTEAATKRFGDWNLAEHVELTLTSVARNLEIELISAKIENQRLRAGKMLDDQVMALAAKEIKAMSVHDQYAS